MLLGGACSLGAKIELVFRAIHGSLHPRSPHSQIKNKQLLRTMLSNTVLHRGQGTRWVKSCRVCFEHIF